MRNSIVCLFSLLLCFTSVSAIAQKVNPAIEAIRLRSDTAINNHNMPLYLTLARQEYAMCIAQKDTIALIRVCVKMVDFFTFFQRNDDSIIYYRNRGVYWARLKKDLEHEIDIESMKASQFTEDGKFVEAFALYQKLDSIVLKNNFHFKPYFDNSYATLLFRIEKYQEGIARLRMSAEGFEKQKEYASVATVYGNIAGQFAHSSQYDSAFYYINKALKINISIHDTFAIAECYTRVGYLYALKKNNVKALQYFKISFELNNKNPSDFLLTNYTGVLAAEGKYKEADKILIDLKDNSKEIETQLIAINALIDLKEKEGKFKEALAYSKEYLNKENELLDIDKIKQIEELQTQYDVSSKENEISLLQERNEHQAKTLSKNRVILYVGVGLFLMILLAVFLIFRNRSIRSEAEQILLEQQLLRLQMNPHFIFNSLTTIQSTVLQKEHLKAAGYIATFSKLVRNILENSTQSKVLFSSELTALKDYLVLQKIRFPERLNYEIEVDESVEEDMIFVPPMLFQPIVENAIEHGISEVKQGLIHISFRQSEYCIHCTVTDNGIGYGNNIKSSDDVKKKTSLSTQITKRRLAIFSKHAKRPLDYKIIVLKEEQGAITGTKVEIDIPILS